MSLPGDYAVAPVDFSEIDSIRTLWEELNASHAALSTHFGGHFRAMTFAQRKTEFGDKAARGRLHIDVCNIEGGAQTVGYCVSNSIGGIGEIDSLFVKKEHRGRGAGSLLVKAAVEWMRACGVGTITLHVAVGNESVLAFYEKFGLYPRLLLLTNKPPDSK